MLKLVLKRAMRALALRVSNFELTRAQSSEPLRAASCAPAEGRIMQQMTLDAQRDQQHVTCFVDVIVVGNGQFILPADIEFAWASALQAAILTLPVIRLFDLAGKNSPVKRI